MAKRRASGEGSVSKRADGRWEGRIIIGRKENGRPIYKSVFAAEYERLFYVFFITHFNWYGLSNNVLLSAVYIREHRA